VNDRQAMRDLRMAARTLKGASSLGTFSLYNNGVTFRRQWGEQADFEAFKKVLAKVFLETYGEKIKLSDEQFQAINNRGVTIAEFWLKIKNDASIPPRNHRAPGWDEFHAFVDGLRKAGYRQKV